MKIPKDFVQKQDAFKRRAYSGKATVVSPSQLIAYEQCAAKWWFQKTVKPRPPVGPWLFFGILVDGAVESLLKDVIAGKKPDLDRAAKWFDSKYDGEADSVAWTSDTPKSFVDDAWRSVESVHAHIIAPGIKPILTQAPLHHDFDGTPIIMFADWLEHDDALGLVVTDLKTGGKHPGEKMKSEHWFQTMLYVAGVEALLNVDVDAIRTVNAIRGESTAKKGPIVLTEKVTDAGRRQVRTRAKAIISRITTAEKHLPNRNHPFCTQRWCQYCDVCVDKFGGKVRR